MQVDFLHGLVAELRSRYYFNDELKKEDIKINGNSIFELSDITYTFEMLKDEQYQFEIYKFVNEFMAANAEELAEIMDWEYEWAFDEES